MACKVFKLFCTSTHLSVLTFFYEPCNSHESLHGSGREFSATLQTVFPRNSNCNGLNSLTTLRWGERNISLYGLHVTGQEIQAAAIQCSIKIQKISILRGPYPNELPSTGESRTLIWGGWLREQNKRFWVHGKEPHVCYYFGPFGGAGQTSWNAASHRVTQLWLWEPGTQQL